MGKTVAVGLGGRGSGAVGKTVAVGLGGGGRGRSG